MLQLSSAGKRFGPKLLFEDLNWMITAQDRVGLVDHTSRVVDEIGLQVGRFVGRSSPEPTEKTETAA